MKKFWIQFSLFLLFALVIPISFIAIRFKLFSTTRQINTLTIWAFIAIALIFGVLSFVIKVYLDGMKTKYSIFKQILQGIIKFIFPMVIVLLFVIMVKQVYIENAARLLDNLNSLIQVLIICIISESIAVVINPLPKWSFDNNVDGLVEIYDKMKGGKE